jgi:hypothetical protein
MTEGKALVRGLASAALVLAFSVSLAASDGGVTTSPVPKGDRLLGGIDWGARPDAVIPIVYYPLDWVDIETAPNKYGNEELSKTNKEYGGGKALVDITIRPLHTNRKRVPNDLMNVAFDDPVMIDRFEKLLDYVFGLMPDAKLLSLVIGSEMDIFLGTDEKLWKQWETFFKATSAYARTKRPGLKVASEGTFNGMTGSAKDYLLELNKSTDVVGVSHYPTGPDFRVQPPSEAKRVFDAVAALYPGRVIYFYQLGYPSSPLLDSSEQLQAEFFKEMFRAWDAHADQIKMIKVTWQSDISKEGVDYWSKFYGLTDQKFMAFLGSLGLQNNDGTDKEAMKTFRAEAHARGW